MHLCYKNVYEDGKKSKKFNVSYEFFHITQYLNLQHH